MSKMKKPKLTCKAWLLRMFMTKEERHLWDTLGKLIPYAVYRKQVIGPYIVDCYIPEAKLVVELDQSRQYDDQKKTAAAARDKYLRSMGLTVLRYSYEELKRDSLLVCTKILNRIPSK